MGDHVRTKARLAAPALVVVGALVWLCVTAASAVASPAFAPLQLGLAESSQLSVPDLPSQAYFGWSIALDGDTALVGAPGANEAFAFVRAAGVWQLQQVLTADGGAAEFFGGAVALAGDTALVGAQYTTVAGKIQAGAVYVFARSAGHWSQQKQLVASDASIGDLFGTSVAFDGQTAVVGAPFRNGSGANARVGAAFIFSRASGWAQQAKLSGSGLMFDEFGQSTAVDGDIALVGEPYNTISTAVRNGLVYTYVREHGVWTAHGPLADPDGGTDAEFGRSIALDGQRAIIGAPGYTIPGPPETGSAYVLRYAGGLWLSEGRLRASDGSNADAFGRSVALEGDVALVGAPQHGVGAQYTGIVYVYRKTDAGWTEAGKLSPADPTQGDHLGWQSVAISGDTALAGAPDRTVGVAARAGATYDFFVEAPPRTTATLSPAANAAGWNSSPVTVTLDATDTGSGVATTVYRLLGSPDWTIYTGAFKVSAPGTSVYEYRSTDVAGLAESPKTFAVHIGALPTIARLSPASGKRRSEVTLTGTSFGAKRGTSLVMFGGSKCVTYARWSDTRITVRVPGGAAYGTVKVTVVTAVGTGKARSFKVLH